MAPGGRWLLDHLWPPADELSDLTETDPRAVYKLALRNGWSVSEASSLAAYVVGLPLSSGESGFKWPWTMHQVYHCLWLRRLYVQGTWTTPTRPIRRGSRLTTGRKRTHEAATDRP